MSCGVTCLWSQHSGIGAGNQLWGHVTGGGRIPWWKTLVQQVIRNKTSLRLEWMRGVSTHGRSWETWGNSANKTLYSCPGGPKCLCPSGPVLCLLRSVHPCVLPAPRCCSSIYCFTARPLLGPPWCDKGASVVFAGPARHPTVTDSWDWLFPGTNPLVLAVPGSYCYVTKLVA